MLKAPAHPDKSFACGSDVAVPAVEFEHVGVFAPGDRKLYVEIHSVVLRSYRASPLSAPLWLRDDWREFGGRRFGTRNKSFAAGLTGLGLFGDFHGFQRKAKTRTKRVEPRESSDPSDVNANKFRVSAALRRCGPSRDPKRRFVLGWNRLVLERSLGSRIVTYAVRPFRKLLGREALLQCGDEVPSTSMNRSPGANSLFEAEIQRLREARIVATAILAQHLQ
jgi:hypothetical protein